MTGREASRLGPLARAWRSHPDWCAVLLLLAVAVPSRLLFLGADPPADVQKHYYWDEGLWAHNARVHELRGTWVVDDHNPPLVLAPLYTVTLSAVYRVLGSSLATTRLVSALSGILTCLLLYWAIRAARPPGRALGAALAFTLSYFVVTHQRIAFTEAHQLLWIVLGVGGVLWGARQPRWALVGGLGIALAQLVKASALILVPAIGGFWLWRRWSRRRDPAEAGFSWAEAGWFVAGGAAVALPLAALVLPNWEVIWGYLSVSLRSAGSLGSTPRVELPGGLFRLPPEGFVIQGIVPVTAVGLLGWLRLLRAREDRPDSVERLAWLWLGLGLLTLGVLQYQPDRRFLLLAPPLAILFATAVTRMAQASEPPAGASAGFALRALAGATAGFAAGWAIVALGVRSGGKPSLPEWPLLWSAAIAAGALASIFLPWKAARWVAALPLWLLVPLFLLAEPARFAAKLGRPQFTMRDAARRLAVLGRGLPAADRILVGEPGSSLTLESGILAIPMRDNPATGARMNMDAWDRFHPALALYTIPRGKLRAEDTEAERRGFRSCLTFDLLTAPGGGPFRRVELWVRPDLTGRCGVAPAPATEGNG